MSFEVAPRAYADLEGLTEWFRVRDPVYGAQLLRRLWATFERIAEAPLASPLIRSRRRGVRGWVARPYVIYYRISGETVLIERVLHGRQRRPRLP